MAFTLVKNSKGYWRFIKDLREMKGVSQGFISQSEITDADHTAFMEKHSEHYHICLLKKKPIGFIGLVNGDLRLAVLPEHQGKGAGHFMLQKYLELYDNISTKIKPENTKSLELFKRNGFSIKYLALERHQAKSK